MPFALLASSTVSSTPSSLPTYIVILTLVLGSGGLFQVVYNAIHLFHGKKYQSARRALAKAAEKAKTPGDPGILRDSLLLGNAEKGMAMQQQLIVGLYQQIQQDRDYYDNQTKMLRARILEQDAEMDERDRHIANLEDILRGCPTCKHRILVQPLDSPKGE